MSDNWIASLYAKIGADVKDFQAGMRTVKSEMKQADTEVKKTQSTIKGLNDTVKMVGAAMAAYGVANAGKYVLELDKLGRASLRLKESFGQLAKANQSNSDQILRSLKDASRGAISETDIILGANRAMMLGLGGDAEQLGKLMEVASFRARAMGITTTQAWNDIVTGIGRRSPLILDNLGIVGLKMDNTTSKAEIMAQVVTSGMKEIADAGGMLADGSTEIERMAASVDNLKTKWGELVAKSGVIDLGVKIITRGVESWSQLIDDVTFINSWAQAHDTKFIDVVIGVSGATDILKTIGAGLFPGGIGITAMTAYNAYIASQQEAERLAMKTAEAAKQWNALGLSIQTAGYRAKELPADYQLPGWTQRADDYNNAYGFSDEAAIEVKNFLIKADRELLEERQKNSRKYWDEYQAHGKEALGKIKALISGAFTSTEDWIRVALQGTSADVGDAWDEMARRAEAVINDMFDAEGKQKPGATSPWLAMFDVPEDVLRRGGDTLKAYMTQLAKDIRESPTVQELGNVGIDAMVTNIKKELAEQIGQAELEQTVALKLATDPEAVALMQQLGIDVSAAVGALQDPIVTSIEDLKTTTLGTNVENWPSVLTEETAKTKLDAVKSEISTLMSSTLKVEVTNFDALTLRGLLSFGDGGVVPGRLGQAQLAVVHGGEVITPPTQVQHNYNLTVNTPMSGNFLTREFNMMRSLAGV